MKILIINNVPLYNHGDTSMLQTAVSRLSKLWPGSKIDVVTQSPDLLAEYCSDALPVLEKIGHRPFVQDKRIFPWRLYANLPNILSKRLQILEDNVRIRWPVIGRKLLHLKYHDSEDVENLDEFIDSFIGADLIVVSGGGFITDAWKEYSKIILKSLQMAVSGGKTTAMFGQGIGPLEDPDLIDMVRKILPSISLISLRERCASFTLLSKLGVPQKRVVVTGDDAIEMAYNNRSDELGSEIGFNLRVTWYSGIEKHQIAIVREAIKYIGRKLKAPFIPVPISIHDDESDIQSIHDILKGIDYVSEENQGVESPHKIILQVKRCRVVVTGSYHAGVFALSQGIPVVALAKSRYYIDKFIGLADQFGCGCDVVVLDDERLFKNLIEKIEYAWFSAPKIKSKLLDAAQCQIKLSNAAYQKVFEIVTSKKRPKKILRTLEYD